MELRHYCSAVFIFLSCITFAVCADPPQQGDVRLVDGHSPSEGRVEVYYNDAWGTICDDGFDMSDATVICRQLGFSSANSSHCCAHFTHGTGSIYMDDLACTGLEARVSDCPHRGWAQHNCAHTEDASVTCNGNIRLRGSNSSIEGRVEVYDNSNWGSICDSGWDMTDGSVVCKQLGYPGANTTFGGAKFGQSAGPVIFGNVQCAANDTDLFNCTKDSTLGPECNHSRDASVRCTRPIRLVGGRNPMEGYVEVYDGLKWGPICALEWGMEDAQVVCKQIGDLAAVEATRGMRFGQSSSSYQASRVGCSGNEDSLDQCTMTYAGDEDCRRILADNRLNDTSDLAGVRCAPAIRLVGKSSFLEGQVQVFESGEWRGVCADEWGIEDAEVVCRQLGEYPVTNSCCEVTTVEAVNPTMSFLACSGSESKLQDCPRGPENTPTVCASATAACQVTVRLSGGTHDLEGNVEITHGGLWGNICDDNWGIEDAQVICRQLGNYEVVSHSCCSKHDLPKGSYLLDDVGCTGDESRVEDCYHSDWNTHNCGTSEAAGVTCRNLRLVSDDINASAPKGRVEVVYHGQWGRVCGNGWNMQAANVLCRQLYNSTAESISLSPSVPSSTGKAFMDNFNCVGTEKSLTDCPHDSGETECVEGGDATVSCRGGLRLVGGRTHLEGRVEIFHDGQWGTVCDDGWSFEDAQVVCRQLGNYAALMAKCCQAYGPGSGPILMDGVSCVGTEMTLDSCPHEGWQSHNCQHYEDASVICTDIKLTADNGTVTTGALEGRVQILIEGEWKSICSKGWDDTAGQVVCQQLFNTDLKNISLYPMSEDEVLGMTNLKCLGSESMLTECSSTVVDVDCSSNYVAAVQCKDPMDSDIRLVGGKEESEGAVEVLVDGDWGLICGSDWGKEEGMVTCRQLGYCSPVSTHRGWDPPIDEKNIMHWHSLNCSGREERLRDCPKGRGSYPCSSYNFEAAVTCKNWCDPPAVFLHGSWSPRSNQYDLRTKVKFTCDSGYVLKGSSILECLDVCEWGAAIPECIESSKPTSQSVVAAPASGIHPAGVFFIGLVAGMIIVFIVAGIIYQMKNKSKTKHSSPVRAGNIFRPKRERDEMEEPVLFSSMNNELDENGDAI